MQPKRIIARFQRSSVHCLTFLILTGCGLGTTNADRVERGEQAYLAGEYRAAIIDAKRVLQDEPENVDARVLLGRALIATGNALDAERELRRAVDQGAPTSAILPDLARSLLIQGHFDRVLTETDTTLVDNVAANSDLLLLRGEALLGLNRPAEARGEFLEIRKSGSDTGQASLGIARSYWDEGDLPLARRTLDETLASNADHARSWQASGRLAMQMGDTQRSESDYRRAVELARTKRDATLEISALHDFSESLLVVGRRDEVRPLLTRLEELAPDDPRTLMTAARLAGADADWSAAQRHLQSVLQILPGYQPARVLLGLAHMHSGNMGQAEMYLSAAVAADPNDHEIRRSLARVRLELDKGDAVRRAIAPLLDDSEVDASVLSLAAAASLQSGEVDEAVAFLERAIAQDPQNTQLRLQLAFANFTTGALEPARRILDSLDDSGVQPATFEHDVLVALTSWASSEAKENLAMAEALVARWPERATAHVVLGVAYFAVDRHALALRSFETASSLAPESFVPEWFLAQLAEAEGRFDTARRRYRNLVSRDPSAVGPMLALARLAARAEDSAESIDWLEKARAADPGAVEPRRRLAHAYLATGNMALAGALADESLRLNDEQAAMHHIAGTWDLGNNRVVDAETHFRAALKLEPNRQEYRLQLARSLALQGDSRAAIATLEAAHDSTFADLASAIFLATLRFDTGAPDQALAIARRLQQGHAESGAPHALEGELLARRDDYPAAVAAYDRAQAAENRALFAVRNFELRRHAGMLDRVAPLERYLDERPIDKAVRKYLAQEYLNSGQWRAASVHLTALLEADPEDPVTANNLAWSYLELGDVRAETFARKAYELQPTNPSVIDTLGWILVSTGRVDEGTTLLRNADRLANGRPEVRYHLAAALVASGDAEEARTMLSELLASAEEFAGRDEAEELLATL